ncbi:HNH endonuclease [Psychrobacter sp. 28M-43]|uniref:HNH endonuclease n=1 Tax=Psychrobacter sp. 28M-43 TaxID=2772254 RepID=UPI001CD13793|nr:HNH endonuclease [Psychrobacter sp. 28M-43]
MKLERQSLERLIKKQRKRAAKAAKEARQAQAVLERMQYIDEALNCVCKSCDISFKQKTHMGKKEAYCTVCAEEVRTKADKKQNRICKSRRRARIRKTKNERIDPIDVFNTADWTCYLCGNLTPEVLRGSYDNRAPELDHIIPLSKGGTHTMDNVACCCRKCNNIKGDNLPSTP